VLAGSDRAVFPASYAEAEALAWCRDRIRHLIDAYGVALVAVRYPEPFGRSGRTDSARKRSRVEGVILEAAHSKGIAVATGALVTISKNLGVKSAKALLEDDTLRGLDWSQLNEKAREAVLAAASGLK